MNRRELVKATAEHIRAEFDGEGTGHDWWHVVRVLKNARAIAAKEGGDLFTIEMAALLHDLDDWKFSKSHDGDPVMARRWLRKLNVDKKTADSICRIVANVSFKGGFGGKQGSIEGKIVQDADRLDALGAIGIARTFAYGGKKDRQIYDPRIMPLTYTGFDDFKKKHAQSTTVNHFYEKLFLLRKRMNTRTAKRIALRRTRYMEDYLATFMKEWQGKDIR